MYLTLVKALDLGITKQNDIHLYITASSQGLVPYCETKERGIL